MTPPPNREEKKVEVVCECVKKSGNPSIQCVCHSTNNEEDSPTSKMEEMQKIHDSRMDEIKRNADETLREAYAFTPSSWEEKLLLKYAYEENKCECKRAKEGGAQCMLHNPPFEFMKPSTNNEGVDPTHKHAMKCPKLYGKECNCNPEPIPSSWEERFVDIGFGNQAKIVGMKRVELKDFIKSLLLEREREIGEAVKQLRIDDIKGDIGYDKYNQALSEVLAILKK